MSIMSSVTFAAQRQAERQAPGGGAASGAPAANQSVTAALEKITAFIPSEVIGIYVAVIGILAPASMRGKWVIFGLCVILVPFFMWLGYKAAKRKNLPVPGARAFVLLLILAIVAFVAWGAALPSTPFEVFHADATRFGGALVIILGYAIPKIADAFDLTPLGTVPVAAPPPP